MFYASQCRPNIQLAGILHTFRDVVAKAVYHIELTTFLIYLLLKKAKQILSYILELSSSFKFYSLNYKLALLKLQIVIFSVFFPFFCSALYLIALYYAERPFGLRADATQNAKSRA